MDVWVKQGIVTAISDVSTDKQELTVMVGTEYAKAINFPLLTGMCEVGDQVILNTTAVELQLGTGGYHFVMGIIGKNYTPEQKLGHLMKVRYTPSQGRVLSVEEEDSPYHEIIAQASDIAGLPVIVGSLHSMLGPVCLGFKHVAPQRRLVYLMSDGAALPLALSNLVDQLTNLCLLDSTITFNHAFGGDYEAVNVYSALLTAKHVCNADAAVILMGPGVVGTGTTWGTTAVEQGIFLNAVHTLKGNAIAIPRISLADQRYRHQGISHHTLTALSVIAEHPSHVPIPQALQTHSIIQSQLAYLKKHHLHWIATENYRHLLEHSPVSLRSMGRDFNADPYFFETALAAGLFVGWQYADTIE